MCLYCVLYWTAYRDTYTKCAYNVSFIALRTGTGTLNVPIVLRTGTATQTTLNNILDA